MRQPLIGVGIVALVVVGCRDANREVTARPSLTAEMAPAARATPTAEFSTPPRIRPPDVHIERWAGEWGRWKRVGKNLEGGHLHIDDCSDGTCKVTYKSDGCSGDAVFTAATATRADAPTKVDCALHFTLDTDAEPPAIEVTRTGTRCDYYCVPNGSLPTRYELRSHRAFLRNDPSCFTEPASLLCTNHEIDALDKELEATLGRRQEIEGNSPTSSNRSLYDLPVRLVAEIQKACEGSAEPATCLAKGYRARIDAQKGLLARGEAAHVKRQTRATGPDADAKGQALLDRIGGVYTRPVMVEALGDKPYASADVVRILPVDATSAYVEVELRHFGNGHQCNLSGLATYRKSGAFVVDAETIDLAFDHVSETTGKPVCMLAFEVEGDRIELREWHCREVHCGARGAFEDTIPLGIRRPIANPQAIRDSDDYRRSLANPP